MLLGLTGHCHNWIPNYSLIAQPLYVLLNSDSSDPIQWNPEGKQAVKALKKELFKSLFLRHKQTQDVVVGSPLSMLLILLNPH